MYYIFKLLNLQTKVVLSINKKIKAFISDYNLLYSLITYPTRVDVLSEIHRFWLKYGPKRQPSPRRCLTVNLLSLIVNRYLIVNTILKHFSQIIKC